MKAMPLVLTLLAASALGGPGPDSRTEILSDLRYILNDMHGGAASLPRYAERMERERGFPVERMKDLLLEVADDESWGGYAQDNAVIEFIDLAAPEDLSRLDPFYCSTNETLRLTIQRNMLRSRETVEEKLTYARARLDWLDEHPAFQSDGSGIGQYFSGYLGYSKPTESERTEVIAFFRDEARNAGVFDSVLPTDWLLLRHDSAWRTNEARRAMIEKWIDDPAVHEKTRAVWSEALAAFDASTAASAAADSSPSPPASERPDGQKTEAENEAPAPADPSDDSDNDDARKSNP